MLAILDAFCILEGAFASPDRLLLRCQAGLYAQHLGLAGGDLGLASGELPAPLLELPLALLEGGSTLLQSRSLRRELTGSLVHRCCLRGKLTIALIRVEMHLGTFRCDRLVDVACQVGEALAVRGELSFPTPRP